MGRRKGRAKLSKNIYKPEFAEQIYAIRLLSNSNRAIANYFNISESTLRQWIHRYPDFRENYNKATIENVKTKHFKVAEKLLTEINKALKNDDLHKFVDKLKSGDESGFSEDIAEVTLTSINDKKLLNMVNSFEKLQKAQRQTLSIVDGDKLTRQDKLKETKHKQAMDNKQFDHKKKMDEENKIDMKEQIIFIDNVPRINEGE